MTTTDDTSDIETSRSKDVPVDPSALQAPPAQQREGDGAAPGLYAAIRQYQQRTGRSGSGLRTAGAVLIPVGLVLIAIGWYGVATNAWEFLQLPYLVSGGILGLSLVVLGAGAYFAYWQLQLLQEVRRQTRLLERVARSFDVAPTSPGMHGGQVRPGPGQPALGGPALVATASGSLKHLPSCPVVKGKQTHVVAGDDALGWCKVCLGGEAKEAPFEPGDLLIESTR